MKPVAALILVGMLLLWTELPAGDAWSCPRVRTTCMLPRPPNQCLVDRHCPRFKKCCRTFCGRKCVSRRLAVPTSDV